MRAKDNRYMYILVKKQKCILAMKLHMLILQSEGHNLQQLKLSKNSYTMLHDMVFKI